MLRLNRYFKIKLLTSALVFIAFTTMDLPQLSATVVNNYQDPVVFHTVMGSDKYYSPSGKASFSLHVSPFYQHTRAANRPDSGKTSDGNIWGPWNMAGLFLNDNPRPSTKPFVFYQQAKNILRNLQNDPAGLAYTRDYTRDATFNSDEDAFKAVQYVDVNSKYEKMGLRGQLSFDLGVGLGLCVKGGIVNMKNKPYNFLVQPQFAVNAGVAQPDTALTPPTQAPTDPNQKPQALKIYENLMGANPQRLLFKEIGIDSTEFGQTDLEDLYGNFYWHVPIKIRENGEHAFSIVPYLSVGASVPMSKDRNFDKIYTVVNGSDGYAGLTAEGSIALDFPNMMQLSAGAGITVYNTRTLNKYHVPTSYNQSGLYPWTTSIARQPGPVWYLNISMKADDIMSKKDVPNFSVYFDYIYAEHLHDSIKIKEPNAAFAQYFIPQMLERDSAWKVQMLHGGVKLGLSKNIFLAFSAQSTIGGSRTYRPTTILGSLITSF